MRNHFADRLFYNAKKNKKIYIVAADISPAGSMEIFRKKYPNRFINVGVAEQIMIATCAGLAMRNCRPFAYTIAAFSLYRPFEMIRDDLCYQNLPVTIVGMGAGTIYSNLGGTHMTQEDVSIAKSIPNMSVISPVDPLELSAAVDFCSTKSTGPVYLRIGKSGEKNFTKNSKEKWDFGKIRKIEDGKNICFLTYGPIIKKIYEIKDDLNKKNIFPSIYSCHTLKPLDKKRLSEIFKIYEKVVILEDHSEINGLAQDVKAFAFEQNFNGQIISFSLKDKFFHTYEKQDHMLDLHGISSKKIISEILK